VALGAGASEAFNAWRSFAKSCFQTMFHTSSSSG